MAFSLAPVAVAAQYQTVLRQYRQNGKAYFITLERAAGGGEVWAREGLNVSGARDILILRIKTKHLSKKQAIETVCRAKKVVDGGKAVVGCLATAGTGVCAATGGGAGVGVPVCIATVSYTASSGLVDCVAGLTGVISRAFGFDDFGVATEQAMGALSVSTLVSTAIDEACKDYEHSNGR